MARRKKDKPVDELVLENIEDGKTGIGENFYPKLDAAYVPQNYYDYIVVKMLDIPSYYDISTIVARSYDALKVGGKLYIDVNETAFEINKFLIVGEMFFNLVREEDGIYMFIKVENK